MQTTFNTLKPYIHHSFENWGGITSDEYRTFQAKYRNFLKKVCKNNGWELVKFMPNHYEFSCFIYDSKSNKFVYLSISDVRYFQDGWNKDILIRHADSEIDYCGKTNLNTTLQHLENDLFVMFNGGDLSCGWAHIAA